MRFAFANSNVPRRLISLGKFGSFPANLLIERPFHLVYEVQDRCHGEEYSRLRVVPAAEVHADTLSDTKGPRAEESPVEDASEVAGAMVPEGITPELDLLADRDVADEVVRRKFATAKEIEELKKDATGAGREIIAKLLGSHLALDKKTTFSLDKYKILKMKKYLRRFTVLPLDAVMLAHWLLHTRDDARVMGIREESLGLIGCWANVHFVEDAQKARDEEKCLENGEAMVEEDAEENNGGRWIVIDDTGGLMVAAMAGRMGLLHQLETASPILGKRPSEDEEDGDTQKADEEPRIDEDEDPADAARPAAMSSVFAADGKTRKEDEHGYALSNTLTLITGNTQPSLYLLNYFGFDVTNSHPRQPYHPLLNHLHTVTWLQVLQPELDPVYTSTLDYASPEEFKDWKAGQRSKYLRRHKRRSKIRHVIDSTRAGGFSGLVVASTMDPVSLLRHTLPLLAGGAPIAIYSPSIEPLSKLSDCFSIHKRTEWVSNPPAEAAGQTPEELERWPGTEEYPVNPSLLLGASVQTTRARRWQVLPGRTHPLMMGKGGPDGYIFTGWREVPATGPITARGKFRRTKKFDL